MFVFALLLCTALASARYLLLGEDPRTWSPVCQQVPVELKSACHELVTKHLMCKARE